MDGTSTATPVRPAGHFPNAFSPRPFLSPPPSAPRPRAYASTPTNPRNKRWVSAQGGRMTKSMDGFVNKLNSSDGDSIPATRPVVASYDAGSTFRNRWHDRIMRDLQESNSLLKTATTTAATAKNLDIKFDKAADETTSEDDLVNLAESNSFTLVSGGAMFGGGGTSADKITSYELVAAPSEEEMEMAPPTKPEVPVVPTAPNRGSSVSPQPPHRGRATPPFTTPTQPITPSTPTPLPSTAAEPPRKKASASRAYLRLPATLSFSSPLSPRLYSGSSSVTPASSSNMNNSVSMERPESMEILSLGDVVHSEDDCIDEVLQPPDEPPPAPPRPNLPKQPSTPSLKLQPTKPTVSPPHHPPPPSYQATLSNGYGPAAQVQHQGHYPTQPLPPPPLQHPTFSHTQVISNYKFNSDFSSTTSPSTPPPPMTGGVMYSNDDTSNTYATSQQQQQQPLTPRSYQQSVSGRSVGSPLTGGHARFPSPTSSNFSQTSFRRNHVLPPEVAHMMLDPTTPNTATSGVSIGTGSSETSTYTQQQGGETPDPSTCASSPSSGALRIDLRFVALHKTQTANISKQETVSRSFVVDQEGYERSALEWKEEEAWTRCHARTIERAWIRHCYLQIPLSVRVMVEKEKQSGRGVAGSHPTKNKRAKWVPTSGYYGTSYGTELTHLSTTKRKGDRTGHMYDTLRQYRGYGDDDDWNSVSAATTGGPMVFTADTRIASF